MVSWFDKIRSDKNASGSKKRGWGRERPSTVNRQEREAGRTEIGEIGSSSSSSSNWLTRKRSPGKEAEARQVTANGMVRYGERRRNADRSETGRGLADRLAFQNGRYPCILALTPWGPMHGDQKNDECDFYQASIQRKNMQQYEYHHAARVSCLRCSSAHPLNPSGSGCFVWLMLSSSLYSACFSSKAPKGLIAINARVYIYECRTMLSSSVHSTFVFSS